MAVQGGFVAGTLVSAAGQPGRPGQPALVVRRRVRRRGASPTRSSRRPGAGRGRGAGASPRASALAARVSAGHEDRGGLVQVAARHRARASWWARSRSARRCRTCLRAVSGDAWRRRCCCPRGWPSPAACWSWCRPRRPLRGRPARRSIRTAAARVFTQRAHAAGVLGYLGHMWELYAMWTWVGVYVAAALAAPARPDAARLGSLAAFVAIGAGAAGCVVAGLLRGPLRPGAHRRAGP